MEKNEINGYTSNVKPVTDAKEVAMEAPERGRVPRCPTNIIEIVCRMYCRIPTEDKGTANHNCLFNSAITNSCLSLLIFWYFLLITQVPLLNVTTNPIFNGTNHKKKKKSTKKKGPQWILHSSQLISRTTEPPQKFCQLYVLY